MASDPTRPVRARSIHLTGIVQGVGYRPFVYNLAVAHGVDGWVINGADGVRVHAEGPSHAVEAFTEALCGSTPPMARVTSRVVEEANPRGYSEFTIESSLDDPDAMTLVSPDLATCPDCGAELADPDDRRFRYPFINCTSCGPRFTIIESIPYDRPATTMKRFEMCPECASEYRDPSDRRFHAQPDACFICGPRLYLAEPGSDSNPWRDDPRPEEATVDSERERSDAIIDRAVGILRDGGIVAVKGLGGYHLCCDAQNEDAVRRLRDRKRRWGKPLAVMVRDSADARKLCHVSAVEEELLTSPPAPIVLLRRRDDADHALAPSVADPLRELGIVLPYTPLQHLLLDDFGGPLVMTSGNLTDEPIAIDDRDAHERLGAIADALVGNDRPILSRYDDSVIRVIDDRATFIRRARGYAPFPLPLPADLARVGESILAVGPEQKATFALTRDGHAFVSQHLGDLEDVETLDAWEETRGLYEHLFRIEPTVVAHDRHPGYLSTKWALDQPLPRIGVQHHHAHVAGVAAEHGVTGPLIGFAFDGTGYGDDGGIWGGEVLLADRAESRRLAHLEPFSLPGATASIRRPARIALGLLASKGLADHPGARPLLERAQPGEAALVASMIDTGLNSPSTTSMGRLFDAVASLIGVADDARYEGEAAILLEAAITNDPEAADEPDPRYRFEIAAVDDCPSQAHAIGFDPLLEAVLDDVAEHVVPGIIARRFHLAIVELIVALSQRYLPLSSDRQVALCGGVFMNRFILEHVLPALVDRGIRPLISYELPANDGAVSYGQAVVALARLQRFGRDGLDER